MRRRYRTLGTIGIMLAAVPACSSGGDDQAASARRRPPRTTAATAATTPPTTAPPVTTRANPELREYDVPAGSHPHDVAVTADGKVWYTAQFTGRLGGLDPVTGDVVEIPLGARSRPHGVIVGPDGAPWITDGGLNAIVRVDPVSNEVREYPLPASHPSANLNTAVFDRRGTLWFTGQSGVFGRLAVGSDQVEAFDAPSGAGPYGITATPNGDVYYASLAGNHIAHVDPDTAVATVIDPPTSGQGTRRVWSDSRGRIWSSQWNAGQVAVYDPGTRQWREWRLPGSAPRAYAVYVDDRDVVWVSDWGANALVRFEPETERFTAFPMPSGRADLRQILGRPGEVWSAESATDKLVVILT